MIDKSNLFVPIIIGLYSLIAIMFFIVPVIIDWYGDRGINKKIKKIKCSEKPKRSEGK